MKTQISESEMAQLIGKCSTPVNFSFGPSGVFLPLTSENHEAMEILLEIRDEAELQCMKDFQF